MRQYKIPIPKFLNILYHQKSNLERIITIIINNYKNNLSHFRMVSWGKLWQKRTSYYNTVIMTKIGNL